MKLNYVNRIPVQNKLNDVNKVKNTILVNELISKLSKLDTDLIDMIIEVNPVPNDLKTYDEKIKYLATEYTKKMDKKLEVYIRDFDGDKEVFKKEKLFKLDRNVLKIIVRNLSGYSNYEQSSWVFSHYGNIYDQLLFYEERVDGLYEEYDINWISSKVPYNELDYIIKEAETYISKQNEVLKKINSLNKKKKFIF